MVTSAWCFLGLGAGWVNVGVKSLGKGQDFGKIVARNHFSYTIGSTDCIQFITKYLRVAGKAARRGEVGFELRRPEREMGAQLTGVRARHFTRHPNHTKMPTARNAILSTSSPHSHNPMKMIMFMLGDFIGYFAPHSIWRFHFFDF